MSVVTKEEIDAMMETAWRWTTDGHVLDPEAVRDLLNRVAALAEQRMKESVCCVCGAALHGERCAACDSRMGSQTRAQYEADREGR